MSWRNEQIYYDLRKKASLPLYIQNGNHAVSKNIN